MLSRRESPRTSAERESVDEEAAPVELGVGRARGSYGAGTDAPARPVSFAAGLARGSRGGGGGGGGSGADDDGCGGGGGSGADDVGKGLAALPRCDTGSLPSVA